MIAVSALDTAGWVAIAIGALMVTTWLVSLPLRNASIVDIVWGPGFVLSAWVARLANPGAPARATLLVAMATVWGARLGGYLWWRNHGHGEDFRYQAMRRKVGPRFPIVSLVSVYGLQGVVMFVVALPLTLGITSGARAGGLGVRAVPGVALWLVGMAFESIGDAQLARFKADPASAGQVMDRGLWRYTRHPNYFGDFCVWWGIFAVACGAPGGWRSVIGPVVMTIMLVRVSGVALLESSIGRRRPGYADYVARTSAFFPRPPRRPTRPPG